MINYLLLVIAIIVNAGTEIIKAFAFDYTIENNLLSSHFVDSNP